MGLAASPISDLLSWWMPANVYPNFSGDDNLMPIHLEEVDRNSAGGRSRYNFRRCFSPSKVLYPKVRLGMKQFHPFTRFYVNTVLAVGFAPIAGRASQTQIAKLRGPACRQRHNMFKFVGHRHQAFARLAVGAAIVEVRSNLAL
jgi:hypothetical protein